jgi:MipA family protein
MKRSTLARSLAALSMTWASVAGAQDGMPGADGPMTRDFEMLLGLGAAYGAAYLGSDERKTRVLPLIAARWRNGWFAGTTGIGYRFDLGPAFSAGVRLGFDRGRDEDDADALRGMGDIDTRPEIGGFVSYRLLPMLAVGSSLRYGSGNDRNGLFGDVSVRANAPLSSSVRLVASATATFANAKAMRSQFGVDALQASRTSYALYTPDSGLRDVALQLGGMVSLGNDWLLFLGVNGRRLMGDAVDSPLTRDRNAAGALATLAFRF